MLTLYRAVVSCRGVLGEIFAVHEEGSEIARQVCGETHLPLDLTYRGAAPRFSLGPTTLTLGERIGDVESDTWAALGRRAEVRPGEIARRILRNGAPIALRVLAEVEAPAWGEAVARALVALQGRPQDAARGLWRWADREPAGSILRALTRIGEETEGPLWAAEEVDPRAGYLWTDVGPWLGRTADGLWLVGERSDAIASDFGWSEEGRERAEAAFRGRLPSGTVVHVWRPRNLDGAAEIC